MAVSPRVPTTVPLVDVAAQNAGIEDELTRAFRRVLDSGQFVLGPEVEALERELAELAGVAHGVGVGSGTDALLVALLALGIGPGDEVLCPAFTFFATAGSIARAGATPVFADVCPGCFNIDVAAAEERVTGRTKAVIPVHLYGQCADLEAVEALAARHGLRVVEDAAQAIGATRNGRGAGAVGDYGTFSFFPTKNLGGFGEGGMITTGDAGLAEEARLVRNHGSRQRYYHEMVGGNFRLDGIQAALLRVKLARLGTYTEARRANAAFYQEALAEVDGAVVGGGCRCGGGDHRDVPGDARLVVPVAGEGSGHIWNQFTLQVRGGGQRDALREHLAAHGVASETYYPLTLGQQPCFQSLPEASLTPAPVAERLARECLSIPVQAELSSGQSEQVAGAVASFFAS